MKALLLALSLVSATASVQAAELPPLTTVTIADGRNVLADAQGLTVYTFDVDEPGVSTCYDSCAKAWPPVLVQDAAAVQPPLGVTTRKDGTLQITLDNQPLYLFVGDAAPGDIKGDKLQNVWHIIVR